MPDVAAAVRALMRRAPQLVTVVTARGPDGPRGITVSSFIPVSLDPPLVLISVARSAKAHAAIAAGHFRVHLLGEDQEAVSNHFAQPGLTSAEQFGGKYAEAAAAAGAGSPRLPGAIGWAECELASNADAGSHTLFTGRVVDCAVEREDASPLIYFARSYRQVGERAP